MLHTTPLECDLPIHLDRVTVESVRKLDPAGSLWRRESAPRCSFCRTPCWMGYIPVSEGRHSRLRLRQGNASVYAVWFGMPPEQLPYTTGDVVDAALNLSVYDSPRGAQLSGRILDLHPAGLGGKLAEQAALVAALRRGTPLTAELQKSADHARPQPHRSRYIVSCRHAAGMQRICSRCVRSWARKIQAKHWWQ